MNRTRRHVLPSIACAWLAGATGAEAQTAAPVYAPTLREGFGMAVHVICVQDPLGTPLPYATVQIGGRRAEQADSNGVAMIERPPGAIYPLKLTIETPGYHPATIFIDEMQQTVEVFLKPARDRAAPAGRVVSLSELSPEVLEEAKRLRQQAQAALDRKDLAEAERLLRQALEKTPSASGLHHVLALVALHRGRLDDAAGWLERGLELEPASPALMGDLGMVRFLQERRQESHRLLTRAVERGYDRPGARYQLGLLALGWGRWKDAKKELERSSADRFPYRDLFLSHALRRLGKTREAARAFLSFIARKPVRLLTFRWLVSAPKR